MPAALPLAAWLQIAKIWALIVAESWLRPAAALQAATAPARLVGIGVEDVAAVGAVGVAAGEVDDADVADVADGDTDVAVDEALEVVLLLPPQPATIAPLRTATAISDESRILM